MAEQLLDTHAEPLADDLIEGVQAISEFTGQTPRRVYYLAENGFLPLFKMGNIWCGRRSTLIRHFAKLEQDAGKP